MAENLIKNQMDGGVVESSFRDGEKGRVVLDQGTSTANGRTGRELATYGMYFFLFVLFFTLLSAVLPKTLGVEKIPLWKRSSLVKRDFKMFDLQDSQTFRFHDPDLDEKDPEAWLADFTVYTPDDNETIIDMEQFTKEVEHIECPSNDHLHLTFQDKDSFEAAMEKWHWVNQHKNRSFHMVARRNSCDYEHRLPYTVTGVEKYNDDGPYIARLISKPQNWSDIAHTHNLTVGHFEVEPDHEKHAKRHMNLLKPHIVNLHHKFKHHHKHQAKYNKGATSVTCDPCEIRGKIKWAIQAFKSKKDKKHDIRLRVTPINVEAEVDITTAATIELFKMKHNLNKHHKKESLLTIPFFKVGLTGRTLHIPHIIAMGPFLEAYYSMDLTASAALSFGFQAHAAIPNDAVLDVNLREKNTVTGWKPKMHVNITQDPWVESERNTKENVKSWIEDTKSKIESKKREIQHKKKGSNKHPKDDVNVMADLQVKLSQAINVKLEMECEVLHVGYTVGFEISVPVLDATADFSVQKNTGACSKVPDSDVAFKLSLSWGWALKLFAYFPPIVPKKRKFEISLARPKNYPIKEWCWGWDAFHAHPTVRKPLALADAPANVSAMEPSDFEPSGTEPDPETCKEGKSYVAFKCRDPNKCNRDPGDKIKGHLWCYYECCWMNPSENPLYGTPGGPNPCEKCPCDVVKCGKVN